ncbi:MAG: dUTP diphosphatase [Megasphaera sp.]|uniref:dUTP diphosphatase n=1 Tax=Megasphaera sp. TaxID=2023260 RepID=UPI003F05E0B4
MTEQTVRKRRKTTNTNNNMVSLKFKRVTPDAKEPYKATASAACYDIFANDTVTLYPQRGQDKAYKVPTGIAFEIPEGYHMQVYVRSSTGLKTKLRLANGTGIVDSDYTDELFLLVENIGSQVTRINKGERIAQAMLVKNVPTKLVEVESLKEGTHAGFGSTGKD